MSVIVRFAPSPTGFLHIGSARTALFNWLFARHHGGKFLLRIEDTDRERSTKEAVDAIFESMRWLELDWDEEPVFQFERAIRHAEVAHELVQQGKAYFCYCSTQELEDMREHARQNGLPPRYNGLWRDRDPSLAPAGINPVVRFKAPQIGETTIIDHVQGSVCLQNNQLDDMVLLRADGTPTYMLSVVVDDHDMGITHIIRGDDHLTNAFRQAHLYHAMEWAVPEFAHIPLIHGPDGAKLSKRHGALGAQEYKDMGFLPEAMRNYLLRLGWSHGDDEIISTTQAVEWFNLDSIGRSPARFDTAKLTSLNAHYIKSLPVDCFFKTIEEQLAYELTDIEKKRLTKGMNGLKDRAKTCLELGENARFYINRLDLDEKSKSLLTPQILKHMKIVHGSLATLDDFTHDALQQCIKDCALQLGVKLGELAQPLRALLTGRTVSPSLFEIMEALEKEETLKRLEMANVIHE